MKLVVRIETGNAAFEGCLCGDEVARVLRELAERVEGAEGPWFEQWCPLNLHDANGNWCGDLRVRE